jgi:hypothetical protein
MNEEIIAGLKNAMERGASVEDAARSFINAGYNASEVNESAAFLSQGAKPLPKPVASFGSEQEMPVPETPSVPQTPKAGAGKTMIFFIVLLMALILTAIFALIFKDRVISLLGLG